MAEPSPTFDGRDGRSAGSLYEFIRTTLEANGGICTRTALRDAIMADPAASERLKRSQGFAFILKNMKHSGFVAFDGELVRRTDRRYGRRRI